MDTVADKGTGDATGSALDNAGLVRADDRAIAIRQLDDITPAHVVAPSQQVTDAGAAVEAFIHVLLAGYEADGVAAAFIANEHGAASVRRFLVVERETPVAAAAMTIHDDVAVLGGASTLPSYRRRGAQALTLEHRLRVAADAGCTLAVATVRPGSTSAANLHRAGFRIVRRTAWQVNGEQRDAGANISPAPACPEWKTAKRASEYRVEQRAELGRYWSPFAAMK